MDLVLGTVEHPTKKLAKNTDTLILMNTSNAQLRGEQRLHPSLKHCAINTKFEVEAKMPSVENPS
ncbi:hypothetical protein FR273_22800 [Vibrio vulnificus]|nr:hypothetical protein [Vibrio vulnificus]